MKTTISQSDFVSAFTRNSERKNQFSYDALCELFAYYEQLEQDTGEEMELDVTAICCDWTEYNSAAEAAEGYIGATAGFEWEEHKALQYLQDNTQVIELKSGVLVLNF